MQRSAPGGSLGSLTPCLLYPPLLCPGLWIFNAILDLYVLKRVLTVYRMSGLYVMTSCGATSPAAFPSLPRGVCTLLSASPFSRFSTLFENPQYGF